MHIGCDVRISVQREAGVGMTENAGQRLRVHATGERMGGEGVPLRYNYDKPEESRNIKGFQGFKPDF